MAILGTENASGVAGPSRVGESPTRKTKMRKKMEKIWGKMRETTGKWGNFEEIFLSCPLGSERLATALENAHCKPPGTPMFDHGVAYKDPQNSNIVQ